MAFVIQNFGIPKGLELQAMRERSEGIHAKANEKLLQTFKGTEEERKVKIDDTTGREYFEINSSLDGRSNIQKYQSRSTHLLMLIKIRSSFIFMVEVTVEFFPSFWSMFGKPLFF